MKKNDIAIEYLDLATQEYVKGENLFSALHLAGAADEMLGKLVRLSGHKDELSSIAEFMHKWGILVGTLLTIKKNKAYVNRNKNAAKHIDSINDLSITINIQDECKDMIERAITNGNLLNLPITEAELAYLKYVKENT